MFAAPQNVDHAQSAYQVVLLAREYLDSLSAGDLARIPEACRIRRILDEADVARYSRRLTEEYWQLRGTAADVKVLQDVWSFFLRAAIRIAQLRESAGGNG